MTQSDHHSWDPEGDLTIARRLSGPDEDRTQTINLNQLFLEEAEDTTSSGSFDLRKVKYATLGNLLQALSVPTLLISRPHTIEFANRAFTSMAGGFDPVGNVFSSLFYNPKVARQTHLLLERVFKERKPAVQERKLQIHGTEIWGRIHFRTIRLGKERMVLAQIENLTAQKELLTTERYKKLVNIFPIGIAEFALKWPLSCSGVQQQLLEGILHAGLVDGNTEFARMYGHCDIRDLLGVPLGRLFPAHGKALALYERWIRKGFAIRNFESTEGRGSGEVGHFENTFIANISDQSLHGFWWLKRDISEKRKMEDEVIKAQKLDSLGILAGGIAHDFNNLLTGILGNISAGLSHAKLGPKAVERFQAAARAAHRAKDLTRQLLTFSKGGAPVKTTASIADLLRDCVTFAIRGSKVICDFSIPQTLWHVEMDEGQISQVVHNLILNAVQAMPRGGKILVRASNVFIDGEDRLPLKEGSYVRVSIADQGIGIRREFLRKIFDPYFTTKENGTGLGLATSYSIIKKHGGLITVRSKVGVGSTFHFYLAASGGRASEREEQDVGLGTGKGRVLVMDDDEVIRDLAADLLASMGYEAALAPDGLEAIRMYAEAKGEGRPFDAIIMDLTVPNGMGGQEAIEKLREMDPDVKAIVSSGYHDNPIMSNYRQYGFHAVLPKPYDGRQMSECLQAIIK